jgi:hypothetical protein
MDNQIEVRQYQGVVLEPSPLKTVKEVLEYYSSGPSADTRKERAEMFGLNFEDIKDVPTLDLHQLEVTDSVFEIGELEKAELRANEILGRVEVLYDEDEESETFTKSGYAVLRWETTEEVKERVSNPEYKKQLKEDAAKLESQFSGKFALETMDVDLSSIGVNNMTLMCSEEGIHDIFRNPFHPMLPSSSRKTVGLK